MSLAIVIHVVSNIGMHVSVWIVVFSKFHFSKSAQEIFTVVIPILSPTNNMQDL